MPFLMQAEKLIPLKQLKNVVSEHLRQLSSAATQDGGSLKILRFEFPTDQLDPLVWLHNQSNRQKMYWSDPEKLMETAGLGSADTITGIRPYSLNEIIGQMRSRLSDSAPSLNYYGGFSFDGFDGRGPWVDFNHYRFVVPRFELSRSEGRTLFACNIPSDRVQSDSIDEIIRQIGTLNFDEETIFKKVPFVQARIDQPELERWDRMINRVLEDIRAGRFEKIVLARQSTFSFDKAINPIALLTHLKTITPNCFHFCIQLRPYQGFLGASPERLYKRVHRQFETGALAGTSPRSADAESDRKLAEDLMASEKTNREHAYVVEAIRSLLDDLCVSYTSDDAPRLWRSDMWQHLKTSFQGLLKEGITDDILIGRLHPTPAIAGTPKEKVMREIADLEPFERGWYAGPVGRIGHDDADFCVAIRSALVRESSMSLFSGAGIVSGSEAREEWNEIEDKITNFLKVFKADPRHHYET